MPEPRSRESLLTAKAFPGYLADTPLTALPLVGRDAELTMLGDAIRSAVSAKGGTIILAGESGIGKTRLAQAAREMAEQSGMTTTAGTAFPVEVGVPYAPWTDALLPLVRSLEPSTLSLLTRGVGAELAQILPTITTAPVRPHESDPVELKARLLWTVSQFLARLSERRPLVIVLENLQWADAASLELLHFVARQCAALRVLLLCTYSETERDQNDALVAAERSLLSLGLARVHHLAPLPPSAVDELLARTLGDDSIPREFATLLFGWTRGNPFFLEQTLKSMIESGRLYERDGVWHGLDIDSIALPRSVKDALIGRIRRLTPRARSVVELAAVIGNRASHAALLAASSMAHDHLLEALDELRAAHILEESDERGEVVYDFTHPMLRQTVADELGLARSRLLHRRVAESLEALYGAAAAQHSDELAFHFLRAGAAELAGKTAGYLVAAGRNALAVSANREAVTYLESALSLMDDAGDVPAEIERGAVMEDLAQALQRSGQYDAALKLWERARESARERGDPARLAGIERRMGLACYWRGRSGEALAHYHAGLTAAREAGLSQMTARLMLTRGACYHDIGDFTRAEQDVLDALRMAGELEDQALLARVHRALLLLYTLSGRVELAHEHGALTLRFADESDQPAITWSAHWALAILGGLTGDFDSTRRHQQEAERLADELRSPVLRLRTAEMTVGYCYGVGEWDRAISVGEHAVTLARSFGQQAHLARLLAWLSLVYLGRDEQQKARAYADEAWELSGAGRPTAGRGDVNALIVAHTAVGFCHLTAERYDDAIAVANAGLEIADRHNLVVWEIYRLLPIVTESLLWQGRFDEAELCWQRLRKYSDRLGHRLGVVWAECGHALVDTLRGTTRPALLSVEAAADQLEEVPFIFDSARLRREIARRWVELGDRESALAALRRAHEIFARLGAEGELRGTREQIRQLGVRPPSRSAAAGVAGLSAREVEIVRLVAARRSNKEIGRLLGISARTVSTHLSNIFAKVNVASRGELADCARANDLLT